MTRMYRVPPACSKKWKNLSRRLLQLLAATVMMMVVAACNYCELQCFSVSDGRAYKQGFGMDNIKLKFWGCPSLTSGSVLLVIVIHKGCQG